MGKVFSIPLWLLSRFSAVTIVIIMELCYTAAYLQSCFFLFCYWYEDKVWRRNELGNELYKLMVSVEAGKTVKTSSVRV